MASIDYVATATAKKVGRANFNNIVLNREVSAVCNEVIQTPLYSVELQGHDRLFQDGFEISSASTFFKQPPNLQLEGTLNAFINLSAEDLIQLSYEVNSKLSPITIFLSSYFKFIATVEKDVGKFYQDFLSCFLNLPLTAQREVHFKNVKPSCPRGSIDGLIGRSGNGNRPMATVKNTQDFSQVYVLSTQEVELGESSITSDKEDLKTVYQPIVQICAFSEMCVFCSDYIPLIEIYGDENTVRPFIYFREFDVLMTTDRPFTFWHNDSVHTHALALLCLLFQVNPFHSKIKDIRKCGWQAAKLKYCPNGYLNCELVVEEDGNELSKKRKNPNVVAPPIPKAMKLAIWS